MQGYSDIFSRSRLFVKMKRGELLQNGAPQTGFFKKFPPASVFKRLISFGFSPRKLIEIIFFILDDKQRFVLDNDKAAGSDGIHFVFQ